MKCHLDQLPVAPPSHKVEPTEDQSPRNYMAYNSVYTHIYIILLHMIMVHDDGSREEIKFLIVGITSANW